MTQSPPLGGGASGIMEYSRYRLCHMSCGSTVQNVDQRAYMSLQPPPPCLGFIKRIPTMMPGIDPIVSVIFFIIGMYKPFL